jgi:hypothetical protein
VRARRRCADRTARTLASLLVAALAALPARAQTTPALPPGLGAPPVVAPTLPNPAAPAARAGTLTLSAAFAGDRRPIRAGLVWRIYEDRPQEGKPVVVARSEAASPSFDLPPGAYVADVTYGFANALKHVVVSPDGLTDQLLVSAGALALSGAIGQTPIPPQKLAFAIYVPVGTNVEGRLVRNGVKAGEIVRLPEGTYHVVSTYGDSNAIQSADLKVENGKVTQATLNHRAATVTLKLVDSPGTEAFAGTAFSVLTPGGDTIREAIGAFPTVTLAEGDYVLIARHDGQVYTQDFKVESGRDRDVEVVAKAP